MSLADRLVELTVPTDLIQRDAKDAFASNFRASFLRDPRAQEVAQRMPGLLDTMVRAGTSKLEEAITALWPDMKTRLSASYAASLTPQELQAAVAFFSEPVGRKLVDAIPALAAGGNIAELLDAAEFADFAAFVRSPAGRKIEALKPQQARDIGEEMNRLLLASMPEINEAVALASRAFVEANGG